MRILRKLNKRKLAIRLAIGFVFLVLLFSTAVIFVILRHKQLCTYDQAINNGLIIDSENKNLCPNILDSNDIGIILSNAFNFNILSKLTVNAQRSNHTTSNYSENCDSNTDLLCWIKQMGTQLKHTDGFTNLLIAVSDNRYHQTLWGNTDSIMVVSLDNQSGKILLISFPRDIYATYNSPDGRVSSKINGIYALYNKEVLASAVEEIIGKPIHYTTIVGFDVFDSLIDQMGGVDIFLEEPFEDLYPCSEVPYNSGYYCDDGFGWFNFPEGWNHLNSFQATVYTRSRYASSDYSRAQRQQNLVKALIDNALNKKMSLGDRFNLYMEMYNTFLNKVETDIELKDLAALYSLFEKINGDTASIVLDPAVNDGNLIYEFGISEVGWVTKFFDYSYKDSQEFIGNIWDNLIYYTEEPKILIVNTTGKEIRNQHIRDFLDQKFVEIQISNLDENISGIRIYDLSNGEKSASVNQILKEIPEALLYSAEIDGINQSKFGEDIVILIGNIN